MLKHIESADSKCPGGVGGTTVYWAMLIDPFGCTIGLNASTPRSRAAIDAVGGASLAGEVGHGWQGLA